MYGYIRWLLYFCKLFHKIVILLSDIKLAKIFSYVILFRLYYPRLPSPYSAPSSVESDIPCLAPGPSPRPLLDYLNDSEAEIEDIDEG